MRPTRRAPMGDPQSRSRLVEPEGPCTVVHHQGDEGGERGITQLVRTARFLLKPLSGVKNNGTVRKASERESSEGRGASIPWGLGKRWIGQDFGLTLKVELRLRD